MWATARAPGSSEGALLPLTSGPLSGATGNAEHAFDGSTDVASMTTPTYTNGVKTGTARVQARQDWSQQCAASTSTAASCPFPEAKAYDHNDQSVQVHENAYLIDFNGQTSYTCGTKSMSTRVSVVQKRCLCVACTRTCAPHRARQWLHRER